MGSIKLVTDIPGPESQRLSQRAESSVARPVYPLGGIFISHGEGALLTDVDGNRFIDFIGGVGCLIVGHAHPAVTKAVDEQINRALHTDFSLVPYESYVELAEHLVALCGGGKKAALFNSGAEAVENAVKVARGATGRPGIVCFEGAFHGRTLMALTMTYKEVPHKKGFGPFAPEVYRAPYPGFKGAGVDESLAEVRRIFENHEVAGLVVEPVLGEGGFIVPPDSFLSELASICSDAGVVFVADEIQCGYGRTGTFLASEQFGIRPDVVLLGKAIGGGLPLSGVFADSELIDKLEPNALGGTYVGNPVACAAGLAVLDVIESEDLLARARQLGKSLTERWAKLAEKHEAIKEVRGLGAMVGVEFHHAEVTEKVIEKGRKAGVLSMSAGPDGSVIRHLMPLVITDEELAEGLRVFEEVLAQL
jgi:4-aminobutyrate aminotransferase/(S)-3-amino-2-methylpropionate transaminase